MNIIICLDDKNGMIFNHRRQSRDSILQQRIIEKCAGERLLMNEYSGKLFADAEGANIEIAEDFLNKALPGDYCFVEIEALSEYENQIETLMIYHWNRTYPADMYFDFDLSAWQLVSTDEFAGSSHEKITEEIYIKAGK